MSELSIRNAESLERFTLAEVANTTDSRFDVWAVLRGDERCGAADLDFLRRRHRGEQTGKVEWRLRRRRKDLFYTAKDFSARDDRAGSSSGELDIIVEEREGKEQRSKARQQQPKF